MTVWSCTPPVNCRLDFWQACSFSVLFLVMLGNSFLPLSGYLHLKLELNGQIQREIKGFSLCYICSLSIFGGAVCVYVCIKPLCVWKAFCPCLGCRFKAVKHLCFKNILWLSQTQGPELPIYIIYLSFWTKECSSFQCLLSRSGGVLDMHCLSIHDVNDTLVSMGRSSYGDQKGAKIIFYQLPRL